VLRDVKSTTEKEKNNKKRKFGNDEKAKINLDFIFREGAAKKNTERRRHHVETRCCCNKSCGETDVFEWW